MKENKLNAEVVQYFPTDIGLEKVKEKKTLIKCNNCNTTLVELIEVTEIDNEKIKIKVFCDCGGSSFLQESGKKNFINPLNNSIIDIEHAFNELEVTKIRCKRGK